MGRPRKTHYELLGVPQTASTAQIAVAHRKTAKLWHPDVCHKANAADMFKRCQEAYEILSDPQARAEYDRKLLALAVRRQPQDTLDIVLRDFGITEPPKRPKPDTSRHARPAAYEPIPDGHEQDRHLGGVV